LLALSLATAASPSAKAQEAVMSRLEPAVAGDSFFAVLGANVDGKVVPRGQLTVDYQHRPFVLVDEVGNELAAPSASRLLLHGSASLAIVGRVLVSVDAPFAVLQRGDTVILGPTFELAPTSGAAIGEVRVGVRARLFGEASSPCQIGVGGFMYLPTATDPWGGEGYVYGQPTLQLSGRAGMFRYGSHLGAKIRRSEDPTSLQFAAGFGVSLLDDALFVGPEAHGSYDLTAGAPIQGLLDLSTGAAFEVLGGVQYRFLKNFVVGAAAGSGVTEAVGSPQARVLVRLAYSPPPGSAEPPPPPPPPDSDRDGIVDPKDACPKEKGVASAEPKKNGCPPPKPDDDEDGIPDDDDACPALAGIKQPEKKSNGCPPDSDKDGVFDLDDACPSEVGPKSVKGRDRGCPDKDGDTIADRSDACIDVSGFANSDPKANGCPRAVVTEQQIVINQRIEFETDKATILEESFVVLDAVATILEEHPEIVLLEVGGHADDMGEPFKNVLLSQSRATSVVDGLRQRGINVMRLQAKGYSSMKPSDSATTDQARKKNRRVEFKIVLKNPALAKKK
jgi:outer membrane protein OmpA-like peptidoglycan-associated protein